MGPGVRFSIFNHSGLGQLPSKDSTFLVAWRTRKLLPFAQGLSSLATLEDAKFGVCGT